MTVHKRSCDQHVRTQTGCDPCRRRAAAYESRRDLLAKQGIRLSAGAELVVRWLRELRAAGYSRVYLAERTGLHVRNLERICFGETAWVQLRTFHAVQRIYAELAPFPGPSKRAATYARYHGWTPPQPLAVPDDWDGVDPHAVERAVGGDETVIPHLTTAEKAAAWQLMETQGLSAKEIGRRLHADARSVTRWRAAGRIRRQGAPRKTA